MYLDISNFYYSKGLNGFGNWFKVQAQEERDHAMLFLTYLQNNGDIVVLDKIDAPDKTFDSYKDPLLAGLLHEQFVTASINSIYEKAFDVKDFRTMEFLAWFIKEQGEEEKNSEELIQKFDLFGGDSKGLYLLDNELGTRVYSPPSLVL